MRLPKDLLSGIYTKPRIFLCEVDKERICQLETTNTSATLKFNSYSELSFDVGRTYNNVVTGETLTNPHYDKIEALRLIEVENFGYFEIQGPELVSDGIKEAKNITAYSLEYTLSQKYISNFIINTGAIGSVEVTYAESKGDINNISPVTLYNPATPELSLLHLTLKEIYGWNIGHVDMSLQTLSRSFEVDRESVYDFLMNDVCEKFNCYIVFDTINNTINVYAESLTSKFIGDGETSTFIIYPPFAQIGTVSVDGYKTTAWEYNSETGAVTLENAPDAGSHIEVVDGALTEWETDVFVSFDNLSNEININYDADSIKTRLTVTYGDDGDIREANLGLPYLTDISYYYTVDWMGQDLYDAYTAYMQKSNDLQEMYTSNSQEILKLNDQIYYEETRLSLDYSLVQSVGPTTVGTYYIRQEKSDGTFYYKEVSLPGEYNANEQYYSNLTANVTETKMSGLYSVLKKYFNNENTDDGSKITSWSTDFDKLDRDFSFVDTLFNDVKSEMQQVSDDRIAYFDDNYESSALNRFLSAIWGELGRTPLRELYLKPYQTIKDNNIQAGWAQQDNDNYGYYYPVLLYIKSIEAAIADRDAVIAAYEQTRDKVYGASNHLISYNLAMDKNFTEQQLIKLSAFIREDELHIDSIVETSQDDLSSSFKVKQDAMESGRIELQKLCQPQLQFSMTMANIYALPEFEPIIDQFQLGNVIKVALRPDYIKQSRIMQVNINFDDFSDFSCEFGELTSLRSQSDIHADLLKNAITAGKSVATNSSYWSRGTDIASSIDLKIQQGLLDATTQIKAIDGNQGMVIDQYGIHLRSVDANGNVDPKQGWITNNQFLFSDDGFKSTRAVFGEFQYDGQTHYGILASSLVGSLIIGSQIYLENNDATMTFGADGLFVKNDTNSFNVNPNNSSLLSISNGDEKIFYVDESGTLHVSGTVNASGGSFTGDIIASGGNIGGWTIDGDKMFTGCVWDSDTSKFTRSGTGMATTGDPTDPAFYAGFTSQYGATPWLHTQSSVTNKGNWSDHANFYVTNAGKLYANNADIVGGDIGGWKIASNRLSSGTLTSGTGTLVCGNAGYSKFAFAAGASNGSNGEPAYGSAKFRVTHAGVLYAEGATIDGVIKSNNTSNGLRIEDGHIDFYYGGTRSGRIGQTSANDIAIELGDLMCNYDIKLRPSYYLKSSTTGGRIIGLNSSSEILVGDEDQTGDTYIYAGGNKDIKFYNGSNIVCRAETNGLKFPNNKGIILNGSIAFRYHDSAVFTGIDTEPLRLVGSTITANGGSISTTSDERKKNSIVSLDDRYGLLLDALSAKTYKFNEYRQNTTNCGFIAQELLSAMSDVGLEQDDFGAFVDVYGDGREYAIDYTQFVPIMWEEIKSLRNRILELENKG